MPTLVVEDIPDELYERLMKRAARTGQPVGQLVTRLLQDAVASPSQHSILALQGLRRDIWRGIDADTGHRAWE